MIAESLLFGTGEGYTHVLLCVRARVFGSAEPSTTSPSSLSSSLFSLPADRRLGLVDFGSLPPEPILTEEEKKQAFQQLD